MAISEAQRAQRLAAVASRMARGIKGGRPKGAKSKETLEKEKVKLYLEQRYMSVADRLANAQISLAVGQTFLYKIEKEYVPGKNGAEGFYKNLPPKLVTEQSELEEYLTELSENNGDPADDKSPEATYYFLTTKEPNNEALKDIQNRVLGKPKETVEFTAGLSLLELAKKRQSEIREGTATSRPVLSIEEPQVGPSE